MTHLYINGKDVSSAWGAYLDESGLIALMTPPPNKEYLSNKSANAHGKAILLDEKLPAYADERQVTLTISIKSRSKEDMLAAFAALCEELGKGKVDISTGFQPDVVYHLYYESCSQLQTFFRGIAKFTLKFNEPNPKDRTKTK